MCSLLNFDFDCPTFVFHYICCKIDLKWSQVILKNQSARLIGRSISASGRECILGSWGDGSAPDDGIYVLLKEVLDNSVDEFMMGNGRKIDVIVSDELVSVRDYGRGIPLGKLLGCGLPDEYGR